MHKIEIKPLSVNQAFNGRRTRSKIYNNWIRNILIFLPSSKEDFTGQLKLSLIFGFSNRGADLDNPTKTIQDVLSKKYCFNDNQIYEIQLKKEIVSKGQEFIKYELTKL